METQTSFESGRYVKILSGSHKDEEAELDTPLSTSQRVWVVILESGEKVFCYADELEPVVSMSEKFRQFLEN